VFLSASPSFAQHEGWLELPLVSVLHQGSLPLQTWQAAVVEAGEWRIGLVGSYANTWHYTWHVGSVHRFIGRLGEPLTDETIDILQLLYPEEEAHQVDVEQVVTEVVLEHGLGRGFALAVAVPLITSGSPNWDSMPEDFHEIVGAERQRRDFFERGQTAVFIQGAAGSLARLEGLDGSGVGDVAVALAFPMARLLGGEQRLSVVLEAPTGDAGTLRGSGGWDAGLRLFSRWRLGRIGLGAALGYSWLDSSGSWLGLERRDTWHGLIDATVPLGRRVELLLSTRADASPIEGFGEVSDPTLFSHLGVRLPLGRTTSLTVGLGEDLGSVVPDFTFQVRVGATIGRSRAAQE
jgi:hypothetical protein